MKIGTREVGPGHPTFIIAECGSNHGGSLDAALALIDAAAEAGADAAKFQYFRVDRFLVARENPESLRAYELPDAWLPQLRARCNERGIEFLCTAFDFTSLQVIDPFVNAHKIGSYEAEPHEFTSWARRFGKPVITSEGRRAYTDGDVRLRCVSEYPAKIDGYLAPYTIPREARRFWGVSDHTLDPIIVPAAAVALGASVVEKHMQLDSVKFMDAIGVNWEAKQQALPDFRVSILPHEFGVMVDAVRKVERCVR